MAAAPQKPSSLPMWIGILGGVEIILGAGLNLFPSLPAELSYALITIGVITIVGVIIHHLTELGKWKSASKNPHITYRSSGTDVAIRQSDAITPGAFIDVSIGDGITVNNSNNVSSFIDSGIGDYTILFAKDLPSPHYSIVPVAETPRDFVVVSATSSGTEIKFSGTEEPKRVALKFDPI